MSLNVCFTCFRRPEDFLFVLSSGGEFPINDLLIKHFWFQSDDFREEQVLCRSCWNQLETFHRFYLDVKQNYENNGLPKSNTGQIKEEQEEFPLPPVEVKLEASDSNEEPEEDSSGEEFTLEAHSDDEQTGESDTKPTVEDNCTVSQGGNPAAAKPKRKYTKKKKAGEPAVKKERKAASYQVKSAEQLAEEDEIIKTHVQYICETCGANCSSFTKFQKHVMEEHGVKGCIVCCGRRYHKKVRLLEHVQQLVNPDLFKCDICNKSFINNHGVRRHKQEMHLPEEFKIYPCDRCSKRFAKKSQLTYHLKGHENLDNATVKCSVCDKIFPTEALLKTHIKIRHTRPTDYICDVCAKGFYSKTEFLRHKKQHELSPAELRVQCDVCLQWLKNKISWRKHYSRHNQAPVACDLCGHISPNRAALAGHKRHLHREGESRHVCQECGKEFKRAINLREHMASHTGEALYTCTFCDRTFNSNANMFSHRKKMHPKEWLEQRNAQLAAQQGVVPSVKRTGDR